MPSLDAVSFITPGSLAAAIEVTVANIASPTELNSRAAAQGDIILARTTEAGTGTQTWYYADTTSDAESLPYIVSSATAGVKFTAVAGRYQNQNVNTAALTASRVVATDASKNLETPATVTTSQAWAFTSTMTVVDGNFSIVGSGDSTKTIKFEVDAQTTADDLTINSGAQTDDRTLTVPVLTGNATLAVLSETQTFTGAKTFSAGITTVGANSFVLGLISQVASNATASSSFPIAIFKNTDTTDNNGAGFRFVGTATDSVEVGGAGIACQFSAKGASVLSGALAFDTSNAGTYATRLTIAPDGDATFSSTVISPASTTSKSSMRIPHGSAPSSPADGDMWTTTAGLFVRINGATVGPLS